MQNNLHSEPSLKPSVQSNRNPTRLRDGQVTKINTLHIQLPVIGLQGLLVPEGESWCTRTATLQNASWAGEPGEDKWSFPYDALLSVGTVGTTISLRRSLLTGTIGPFFDPLDKRLHYSASNEPSRRSSGTLKLKRQICRD